jgi:hypothetical protein
MPFAARPVAVALAAAFALLPQGTSAATVSALAAHHRHGQTFLTWTAPAGTGWRYRVYRGTAPIVTTLDLDAASLVGSVGDSTWCDRRLSVLRNQTFAHAIDSLAPPLVSTQGLCVITPQASRLSWYAVTAQQGTAAEDRTVIPGGNALGSAVTELLALTRPVYQRTLTQGPTAFDVYTTWANPEDTPLVPAMTTGHGFAFDHAVVRGTPGGPLHMRPHARGGNFLGVLGGSGEPGEWRVGLDDHLYASSDRNSFWYGYHAAYDLADASPVTPLSGVVRGYTLNRILHTFAWARRELAVDTTRVIASGGSMGAIGSLELAFAAPAWLAGIHLVVPKFDFSFTTDPNPANIWNAGSPERTVGDHLWGAVGTNLPTDGGLAVYEQRDKGVLAGLMANTSLPYVVSFTGRNDVVVGWAEKIAWFAAVQAARHGGMYFWDQRTHNSAGAGWLPMQNVRDLYRLRTNRSYPALSGSDHDDDPGDGSLATGDTLGTMNGGLTWDSELVDEPGGWGCVLRLRELTTAWNVRPAPESALVTVTPRRLQRFQPSPGEVLAWQARRIADDALVQSGEAVVEPGGRVSVHGVRVHRSGTRLGIVRPSTLAAGPAPAFPTLRLAPVRNPARGTFALRIIGPTGVRVRLAVHDPAGRLVRSLGEFVCQQAGSDLPIRTAGLPAGLYFLRAQGDGLHAGAKVVVLD